MITPDGRVTVQAKLLMCSVFLPARAVLLNMKQFNGEYGCCYCEDKNVPRATSNLHHNGPFDTSSSLRSHTGIILNAKTVLENKKPVTCSCMQCSCQTLNAR